MFGFGEFVEKLSSAQSAQRAYSFCNEVSPKHIHSQRHRCLQLPTEIQSPQLSDSECLTLQRGIDNVEAWMTK